MNQLSLFNWMLLSTVLLGLWWACYRLALRQERSFAYNRGFLVLGAVLAAGLPLLPLAWPASWWGTGPAGLSGMVSVVLPAAEVSAGNMPVGAAINWGFWLRIGYLTGVVLMLVRLASELARLWLAARRLPRTLHPGYTLVETHGRLPTSSFGSVIFWDETLPLSASEARQVLHHELAHVRQGHTYDRLLLELLRAALWFNPFVHLCSRALTLTHEYLADAAALLPEQSTPALSASYTHLLARQVASRLGFSVPLAHSFSHSQTLRRIAMIQKTTPIRRWKQWLALPLLGVLLVAVACEKAAPPAAPAVAATSPPPPPAVYESVEQMPELPGGGGPEAIVNEIQQHLAYPDVPPGSRTDGNTFVSFIVTEKGEVQAVKVLKSLGPQYDAAVVAAIQKLPAFVPGRKGGKPVAVSYTVPIRFLWKPTVRAANGLPLSWHGWTMESPGAGC
ncbi:TonB family protein [Hymenobacter negativus]|uniref:TonB family protein n=1 Tax=Hymenobacter negativus TaxID=2795026 RepID=A0ABS3QB20_9BACT|nr:M56 family metallopeptidase [Hymenobacter negativus]MBO2008362.1 TonB family protein [Hymenobacter negativus]